MKFWIYGAVCFLVIGTLFPILRGDGAGVAEGLIVGLGVLGVVFVIVALVWLVKLPFKRNGNVGETKQIESKTVDPRPSEFVSLNQSPKASKIKFSHTIKGILWIVSGILFYQIIGGSFLVEISHFLPSNSSKISIFPTILLQRGACLHSSLV